MKPNIIFILTDDMGAWAMKCAGDPVIKTPNLDKLANGGIRFDNFFCASPVCSPARASILSGRMPSAHGVHDWLRGGNLEQDINGVIQYMDGIPCYTDILADNGYECYLSGKWHLGDSMSIQHGFNHWYTIGRGGCNYMSPDIVDNGKLIYETTYVTDLITNRALQYIDEFKHDSPFYLSVHYTAPHSPWDYNQHKKEHLDLYMEETFDHIPEVAEHKFAQLTAPKGKGERRLELLRGYYAAITALDEGVGKILDKINENGFAENTIVFFCGDNGMNMGHHGIWGKGNGTFPANMYDTSVKVPFIAYSHGGWLKNHTSDEMISQCDIYPTIADIIGVQIPNESHLPGRSFLPLLKGENHDGHERLVVFDEYGPTRMIRTKTDKLVIRAPYGPDEYYDLVNDPNEDNNFIDSLEHSERIKQLRADLTEWFYEHSLLEFDGSSQGVTGFGQMRRMSIGSKGGDVWFGRDKIKYINDKWEKG